MGISILWLVRVVPIRLWPILIKPGCCTTIMDGLVLSVDTFSVVIVVVGGVVVVVGTDVFEV